jgi:hypothetical protein
LRQTIGAARARVNIQREDIMNRRHILGLSVIASLGVALVPGIAMSQGLKQQLVGTWLLTSWEQDMPNNEKLHRFGNNPKGYNVFEANGRFFVLFARPDLPKIASRDPNKPTPEEAKAIAVGSIAYYGTYTVDEATKVISMKMESSTFANQLEADQKRTVTAISATELKMENAGALAGGGIRYVFKRAN